MMATFRVVRVLRFFGFSLILACLPSSISGFSLCAQEAMQEEAGKEGDENEAEVNDRYRILYPTETKPFTLRLVGEQGEPVSGVQVMASGLRCEEDPASWYGWPHYNVGKNNLKVTDQDGKITVEYPVKFGQPPNLKTTTIIDFRYGHHDYVYGSTEFPVDEANAESVLAEGCPVLFTAQDIDQQPVKEFSVMIAGNAQMALWELKDGELKSRGVPDGGWQTMLVSPREDGRHLFSGILPARYRRGAGVTIRDVKLSPGLVVRGRLPDEVQRPVVDGVVIAHCLPKPAEQSWADKNPSLAWEESVPIAADGSFEFTSLPRTGKIQLIALCRGWVIESEPRDGGRGIGFVNGIQVDLKEAGVVDGVLEDVVLPMKEAGALKVKVVNEEGEAQAGVKVSTWPNQMLDLSGSTILGSSYPSVESVRKRMNQEDFFSSSTWFGADIESRYFQTTDKDGVAVLHDIPLNDEEGLAVGGEDWQSKLQAETGDYDKYVVDKAGVKEMEVIVVPISK